jgi:hypothetical protein
MGAMVSSGATRSVLVRRMQTRSGRLLLVPVLGIAGCDVRNADRPAVAARAQVTDAPFPRTLSGESAADLQKSLGAMAVIDLTDAGVSFRALVLREGESDYEVVFYKKSGPEFVVFGPTFHQLGFEPPRIESGAHPVIRVRHRASGGSYHFTVSSDDVDLVPDGGSWDSLQPGVWHHPSGSSLPLPKSIGTGGTPMRELWLVLVLKLVALAGALANTVGFLTFFFLDSLRRYRWPLIIGGVIVIAASELLAHFLVKRRANPQ